MTSIGSRVGHFLVIRALGRGGMGEVYEGFDETLQRRVALKSIRADRRLDESARNRFIREARMLSQLDHPSICRIYDYVEGADVDLLVLEFIEGRTLRSAIRSGLEFREKLRIAAAVAGALAAAHRLGIVHRDLKPDNVMLSADGTVKVLDFGLARAITAAPPAAAPDGASEVQSDPGQEDDDGQTMVRRRTASPLPLDSGTETRVGETVGTPAYMSPEQARGATLTTASDMYSFGLLLQALFTRRDPHPDFLTPVLLAERASRAESDTVSGVDGDVTSLINSLKVEAPSDRPTALDVVERLEWIANRPRRTMRRLAAAAAVLVVLAGAAKYIVDVRRERNVAIDARADAERRRGQAEELVGFMVGDLRTKLTKVGRLDVLDDVGSQALRYFNSLRPDEIHPGELRRNAKTLSQIGEVRMAQGDLTGAEEVLRSSLNLATAAARRDPADAENQLELGASHFWIGSLYRQQGDLPRALDSYRQYLRISDELAAREPGNPTYQIEVGYGHSNVGTVLEQQGKLEEALAHYRQCVAIKERRLETDPARADWKLDLATTVNKVGVVLLALGRYLEAEAVLNHERDLLMTALQADPKDVRTKFRLAVNRGYLGRLFDETGADEAALEKYTEERELALHLVAHDDANTSWQRTVAVTDTKIGRAHYQQRDRANAEASYRRALARLEPLLSKDPDRVVWRRDLALAHEALALVLADRSMDAAARQEIATARSLLAPAPPDEPETRRLQWQVAITAGVVAARAGDHATARREWTAVADALWPTRDALRDMREIDLLARALLHLERIDDAAPLMNRLSTAGYRRRTLVSLWEAKSSNSSSPPIRSPSRTAINRSSPGF